MALAGRLRRRGFRRRVYAGLLGRPQRLDNWLMLGTLGVLESGPSVLVGGLEVYTVTGWARNAEAGLTFFTSRGHRQRPRWRHHCQVLKPGGCYM